MTKKDESRTTGRIGVSRYSNKKQRKKKKRKWNGLFYIKKKTLPVTLPILIFFLTFTEGTKARLGNAAVSISK